MSDTIENLTAALSTGMGCTACGWSARPIEVYPFQCPEAHTGEVEHVVRRWTVPGTALEASDEANPFLRYRRVTRAYEAAVAGGMTDEDYVKLVEEFDAKLAEVSGERGLEVTPFSRCDDLSDVFGSSLPGGIWIKNETRGVGGTHKLRQLYGILLYIEVIDRLGLAALEATDSGSLVLEGGSQDLHAGALLAAAAGRKLTAFVPSGTALQAIDRARALGADVTACARTFDGTGDGRSMYFQRMVSNGALPLTCDTTLNALAGEGAVLLGYELFDEIRRSQRPLDHLFLQIGRGTLASGIVQAWQDMSNTGDPVPGPRLHPVHIAENHPLAVGYERLMGRLLRRLDKALPPSEPRCPEGTWARAEWVRQRLDYPAVQEEFAFVRSNPSVFSSIWHNRPRTLAEIYQVDEVREWYKILEGVIYSGGFPVRVEEDDLERANELETLWVHGDADLSGSAGLGGFLSFLGSEELLSDSRVGIVLSGRRAPKSG